MTVILDAMGSDAHPDPEVQAAIRFAREYRRRDHSGWRRAGNFGKADHLWWKKPAHPGCPRTRSVGNGRQTGGKCPQKSAKFHGGWHGIIEIR